MTPQEELFARAELRRLVERYARSVDDRDAAAFADVFTDDAVLITGRGEVRGREQLLAVPARLERYRVTMHLVGNHDVQLAADGVAASGWTYCIARHVYAVGDAERVSVMHIRYDDRFRRQPDGWRITERRLAVLWEEDHPLRT